MNQVKGKIYLVGLGPGDARHLTPAASAALAACDVVVGYRAYIEQITRRSRRARRCCKARRPLPWSWGRNWSGP